MPNNYLTLARLALLVGVALVTLCAQSDFRSALAEDLVAEASLAGSAALLPNVYNLKASNMQRWLAARANVEVGSARAKIGIVGDSTTAGIGAGTGGTNYVVGARQHALPTYLAASLNARNPRLNATTTSRFGTNGLDTSYDTRMSVGAGWSGNVSAPGGRFWNNSTTTNAWTFTPGVAGLDTATVYYATSGGLGTMTVDTGGSTLETINTATAAALGSTTVALGAATTTSTAINVKRVSGNDFLLGVDAYNSAVPDTAIWNFGASGAVAANIASNANKYDALPGLIAMAPNVIILNIGINDWVNLTDQTAFANTIATLISTYQTIADVVVMIPIPSNVSQATVATQTIYAGIIKAAALTADVPVIDMTARWGSNEVAPVGFYRDGLHARAIGYADEAEIVAMALCAI